MASTSHNLQTIGLPEDFSSFYAEVKAIEKRDSVLTPQQQIERLLRPGSTYFNLNPFEVLQVDPDVSLEEVKKKYKRLSILVHPDKNREDPDRAQLAFDVVCKAWKTLEEEETRKKCLDIVEEAKGRTDMMIEEKRKKLRKDKKPPIVEEDEPGKYKHAIYVLTMKLFADLERRKRELEQRDMEERKRKREQEIEAEESATNEKEWMKNFEESREGRVNSWKVFQSGGKKAEKKVKKFKAGTFKPPKAKPESR